MDLTDFPFDTDVIDIQFDFQLQGLPEQQASLCLPPRRGPGMGTNLEKEEAEEEEEGREEQGPACEAFGGKVCPMQILRPQLQDSALACWQLCGMGMVESSVTLNQTFSSVYLRAFIARHPFYYIAKIVLLLFMSTSLTFSVYVIPKEDIADRLGYIATMFLATGALIFVANDDLPKSQYLTCMDKVVLLSFVEIFLIGVENALAYQFWPDLHSRNICFGLGGLYLLLSLTWLGKALWNFYCFKFLTSQGLSKKNCEGRMLQSKTASIFANIITDCKKHGIFIRDDEITANAEEGDRLSRRAAGKVKQGPAVHARKSSGSAASSVTNQLFKEGAGAAREAQRSI
jgi:hypothetical protein